MSIVIDTAHSENGHCFIKSRTVGLNPRIFKSFPCRFKSDKLCRVNTFHCIRRKFILVERELKIINERSFCGIRFVIKIFVSIVVAFPAPVFFRHVLNKSFSAQNIFPVLFNIFRTGENATHSNDRNVIPFH